MFDVVVTTKQGNLSIHDKEHRKQSRKKGFTMPGPEIIVIEAGGVSYEIKREEFSRLVRPFLYTSRLQRLLRMNLARSAKLQDLNALITG